MTLQELGRRQLASFHDAPLQLAQLHPNFKLPRKWRKLPKGLKIPPIPLAFLVKTRGAVNEKILRSAVLEQLTSDKPEKRKQLVADTLRVRPLAKLQHDKSTWWRLEFPITLGAFLAETKYDLKQLQAFAQQLTKIEHIQAAEADVPYPNQVFPLQENLPGCTVGRASAPQDNFWSQRLIHLMDNRDDRLISEDGAGIVLGHIDTGYTDHFELDLNTAFDLNQSTSVIDQSNGLDPMTSGTSHGTATGSLITSAHTRGDSTDRVAGIAPGVSVVAVRALDFVIVLPAGATDPLLGELVSTFLPSNILAAMDKCMSSGCHVISMSFGGVLPQAVREIIKEAYERDIIMCAAAGNCVRAVVEPAARPEVIACAAVGLDPFNNPRPWTGTSRGPQIDISAPGENVYIADWDNGTQVVRPGEGTSFAAPHLAAAAAVWLEKHGVANLQSQYGGNSKLGDVFREVVQGSATVPNSWDTSQFGAGILNLADLLKFPLPKKADPKGETIASPCEFAMGIINSFLTGDRIPVLSDTVKVRLDVKTIEVRDDGEAVGGSEPYLIQTFYRIDGRRAKAELVVDASTFETDGILNCTFSIIRKERDTPIVKVEQRGAHGNLPEVNIGAIEYNFDGPITINVPNSVGRWDTTVKPIPLRILVKMPSMIVGKDVIGVPGFVGALTMLMEEDFWSDSVVRSVKSALREHPVSVMEDLLKELEFSVSIADLQLQLPQIDAERIALEIEDRTAQSVARDANWWDAFWAAVDGDEMLIQDFTMVNVLQLGPVSIAPPEANNEHGRWLLRGSITER